jgi:hypothetical protein
MQGNTTPPVVHTRITAHGHTLDTFVHLPPSSRTATDGGSSSQQLAIIETIVGSQGREAIRVVQRVSPST